MEAITWAEGDEEGKRLAIARAADAVESAKPHFHSRGSDIWVNVDGTTSVRDSFDRKDYDYFRPGEAFPRTHKELLKECKRVTKRVGLVRNVISLMADFAIQGIDISHPNEQIEKFCKEWFRAIKGKQISNKFLMQFYGMGVVFVKRETGKITTRDEKSMRRVQSEEFTQEEFAQGADMPFSDILYEKPPRREVPCRYTLLNPLSIVCVTEGYGGLIPEGEKIWAIKLPTKVVSAINNPNPSQAEYVAKIPDYILKAARELDGRVFLDNDSLEVFHYKKEDCEDWAEPLVTGILPDLKLLEKMKLADLAALDGVISNIRVWKLGNLEHRILPSAGQLQYLAEILANNVGGGVMDFVWGPDIELLTTETNVHNFLGKTKYAPVLESIYEGLGVPGALTGRSGESGFTNNFLSLKTLVERLQYGRDTLMEFWHKELRLLQKAMGFRFCPSLVFDRMTLNDESAEKQLWLSLWDRVLVSDESVQEKFGLTPEIEKVRVNREERKRRKGRTPPRASPFHDPKHKEALEKIYAQTGRFAPEDFGVELTTEEASKRIPAKEEDKQKKKQAEIAAKNAPANPLNPNSPAKPQANPKPKSPTPQGGRPTQKKDSKKRKQKVVKPRQSVKAEELYSIIHSYCSSSFELTEDADNKILQIVLAHPPLWPTEESVQQAIQDISHTDFSIYQTTISKPVCEATQKDYSTLFEIYDREKV